MLTINEKLDHEPEVSFELFAPKERIVFVDIETTGLKAGTSMLYLIGAAGYEDGTWNIHQFFAESKSDEMILVSAFTEYLNSKRHGQEHLIIVTYNGDHFDIPFLKEVERQYGKSGMFRNIINYDLYKTVRPYKKLLGLKDLKLVTVESFCGVCRKDIFSGADLIPVYEEYLRLERIPKGSCENNDLNKALMKKCLSVLLLHNREDITDMLPVMKMLSYQYLFEGGFDFVSAGIIPINDNDALRLEFQIKCSLPGPLHLEKGDTVLTVCENTDLLVISIPVLDDELRLYFDDYKNYYYLPAEDMAVHRSIGEFVDRKNRIRATSETCYIKEKGKFIEVPSEFKEDPNIFKRTKKGKCYIRCKKELLTNTAVLKSLAMKILDQFLAFPMN